MKIWTINNFTGHWPVGTAAVVTAENVDEAIKILEEELISIGLSQKIDSNSLVPMVMDEKYVRILCDGDY